MKMYMEKGFLANVGISVDPESEVNSKSILDFFSELLELKDTADTTTIQFFEKWGVSPALIFSESEFKKILESYLPIIKTLLDNQPSNLTVSDIDLINENLSEVKLAITSPVLQAPLKKISNVHCFYTNDKLDMEIKLKRIGHPDSKKEARIECELKPKNSSELTCKLTRVDNNLFSYLAEHSDRNILDEFSNKWIVESENFVLKLPISESINKIVFYLEEVDNRKIKDQIKELNPSYRYSRTLEKVICKKIWEYLRIESFKNPINRCQVCYKPVSRPNSKHCGSKQCKDRLKSLINKSYYRTHR